MKLLTIDSFTPYIIQFANKELLTPQEATKFLLIVTELLVDNHIDKFLLKFLSRFFTQQSYDDIVEERNIEHNCGYVLCDKSPKSMVTNNHQIYHRRPSMILPNTYLSQYCCKDHYQSSLFYRNQLSNEALFGRKDVLVNPYGTMSYETNIRLLEEIIEQHKQLKEEKSIIEIIESMNSLTVDENATQDLVQLIHDFQIIENVNPPVNGELDDSMDELDEAERSKYIEGHITK